MTLRTTTFAALLATGALAATGTATAEPAAPEYRSAAVGATVITELTHARFALAPDRQSVLVQSESGEGSLLTLPLSFELDGAAHPILHEIADDGRRLLLTPSVAQPVASPLENQLALNELASNMSKGPLIGTLAGTVIGALVGAAIGLGSCLVVGPGCLATAPAAIAAFAAGGGVLGTLVVGGVALTDGVWKYLTTLQAAPGESPFAGQDGMLDPNGTGVPDANLRLPSGSASGLKAGSSSGSGR